METRGGAHGWESRRKHVCVQGAARRHNRGYNDRYDCSAADINPIGSANKQLVWAMLRWAAVELNVPAGPSARWWGSAALVVRAFRLLLLDGLCRLGRKECRRN